MEASSTLTPRQEEVLDLFKEGAGTKEIAEKLGVSDAGVYQHKRRLVEKGFLTAGGKVRQQRRNGGKPSAAPEPEAGSPEPNVERDVLDGTAIEHVAAEAKKSLDSIDAELAALTERAAGLDAEKAEVEARHVALSSDREKLVGIADFLAGGAPK